MRVCRVCMATDSLISIFSTMDSTRMCDKMIFIGIKFSTNDPLPKFICHLCSSSIIIAASIKKKSLETEKILNEMLTVDVDSLLEDVEPAMTEADLKRKFLMFDDGNDESPTKMNYRISDSTIKITSTNHFNHNSELKSLIENMIDEKPLKILKVTDPTHIKEIEQVIAFNEGTKNVAGRQKSARKTFVIGASRSRPTNPPNSSRLLSALSGQSKHVFLQNNSRNFIFKKKSQ